MDMPWPVLIVGSNDDCHKTILEVLGGWGLEAVVVSDVDAAKRVLAQRSVRMIFCDEEMPDGTYRELLDGLGSRLTRTRLVVLIQEPEKYAGVIQSGAFGALMKPCQRSDIQWIIIRAMKAPERMPAKQQAAPHG